METVFDCVIAGGGIVGLATAAELLRRSPSWRVAVIEKEPQLAMHQTGRNSGVIHSGIYYRPGSEKARLAVRGGELLRRFASDEGVRWRACGKVIVATQDSELARLDELHRRGVANGVEGLRLVDSAELREIEPHAAGVAALHVPGSAIIDYRQVCEALARRIAGSGGEVRTSVQLTGITKDGSATRLETSSGSLAARRIVNCSGLHSDRLALMDGIDPGARIVPFRGEYYELAAPAEDLVRGLIYPVPDPQFPFLGVHLTRSIHGGVHAGPNAVLAFAREGYRRRDIDLRDLAETLRFSGFRRLAARHWRMGLSEMARSLSRRLFAAALQRLVPAIREQDLRPAPAGVRAQAVNADGSLVDDFLIVRSERAIHVCNAPSPAATAALAIAEVVVGEICGR